jgi:hypothetical protein
MVNDWTLLFLPFFHLWIFGVLVDASTTDPRRDKEVLLIEPCRERWTGYVSCLSFLPSVFGWFRMMICSIKSIVHQIIFMMILVMLLWTRLSYFYPTVRQAIVDNWTFFLLPNSFHLCGSSMIRSTHRRQIRDERRKSCWWDIGGRMDLVRFVLSSLPSVPVEFHVMSCSNKSIVHLR